MNLKKGTAQFLELFLFCLWIAPFAHADGLPDFRLGLNIQYVATGIEFKPREPLNRSPTLKFRPAQSVYAGVILGWRWIGGTLSFAIPANREVRDVEGTSRYRDLRITYYTHRLGIEVGHNWFYRYLLDGSNPITVTEDFETRGFGGTVFFALNERDYQVSSALDQSDIQKKSAGSWLLMGTLRDQAASSRQPFIPAQHRGSFGADAMINRMRGQTAAFGGGYSHNFIFWDSAFFAPSLMVTLGYQHLAYQLSDNLDHHKSSPGGNVHFRLGLGWNAKSIFVTINAYADRYSNYTETIELGSNIYGTTLAAGLRF